TDETFKIAAALVRFDAYARSIKKTMSPSSKGERGKGEKGVAKNIAQSETETRRKQMEDLDRAAMDFIDAENSRRSFRMLSVAERLAQAGVATGLAVELAEQSLALAEVATEPDGSLREYPNYDRQGRLAIFRGRALSAKGWALFKSNNNQAAAMVLAESVKVYGSLPEGRRAMWRLATVKETQGELKEALDLYIAGYEAPVSGSEMDVNRAVIESLYRKVNGSLAGLNKLLGIMAPDASSDARITPASARTGVTVKSSPTTSEAAPESRLATESRVENRPRQLPAPPPRKPIELPAISGAEPLIPPAPLFGFKAILS